MRSLGHDDLLQVGGYVLLGVLGEGGMGRVNLERSPGGRTLAIKGARAELAAGPVFRTRFRREAAAARTISANLTAVVAGPDALSPCFATAYMPAPSVAEAVEPHRPFEPPTPRVLMAGMATAPADIHSAGLTHRDLKLSNLPAFLHDPRLIDSGFPARPTRPG